MGGLSCQACPAELWNFFTCLTSSPLLRTAAFVSLGWCEAPPPNVDSNTLLPNPHAPLRIVACTGQRSHVGLSGGRVFYGPYWDEKETVNPIPVLRQKVWLTRASPVQVSGFRLGVPRVILEPSVGTASSVVMLVNIDRSRQRAKRLLTNSRCFSCYQPPSLALSWPP